jgi:hypothetical protein
VILARVETSPEDVQAVTEAELLISPDLIQVSGTG